VEDIDKLARRQVRVTKEHNEECKKLLALMGIPVVTVSYYHSGVADE
jgi:flap endonuclease-1